MMHHSNSQRRRWCDDCYRYVLAESQGYSGWHVVMVMLTCGLWLPVMLVLPRPFRCQRCGSLV